MSPWDLLCLPCKSSRIDFFKHYFRDKCHRNPYQFLWWFSYHFVVPRSLSFSLVWCKNNCHFWPLSFSTVNRFQYWCFLTTGGLNDVPSLSPSPYVRDRREKRTRDYRLVKETDRLVIPGVHHVWCLQSEGYVCRLCSVRLLSGPLTPSVYLLLFAFK